MPVWQDAMQIATKIFKLTEILPKKEDYGFTSQIRRSALSISANIAEAFGRNHTADKINFYYFKNHINHIYFHIHLLYLNPMNNYHNSIHRHHHHNYLIYEIV